MVSSEELARLAVMLAQEQLRVKKAEAVLDSENPASPKYKKAAKFMVAQEQRVAAATARLEYLVFSQRGQTPQLRHSGISGNNGLAGMVALRETLREQFTESHHNLLLFRGLRPARKESKVGDPSPHPLDQGVRRFAIS